MEFSLNGIADIHFKSILLPHLYLEEYTVHARMAYDSIFLTTLAKKFASVMTQANARGLTPIRVAVAMAEAPSPSADDSKLPDTDAPSDLKVVESGESSLARRLGEQVSVGGVLGFACGYSLRRIGRAAMFLVGTEVILLQYMAHRRWLVMDWSKVASDLSPTFSRSSWDKFLAILVYKMPFNVAFTGGLMAGLRITRPTPK